MTIDNLMFSAKDAEQLPNPGFQSTDFIGEKFLGLHEPTKKYVPYVAGIRQNVAPTSLIVMSKHIFDEDDFRYSCLSLPYGPGFTASFVPSTIHRNEQLIVLDAPGFDIQIVGENLTDLFNNLSLRRVWAVRACMDDPQIDVRSKFHTWISFIGFFKKDPSMAYSKFGLMNVCQYQLPAKPKKKDKPLKSHKETSPTDKTQ